MAYLQRSRRAPRRRAARPAVARNRSSSPAPSTTPTVPYSTECADPGRAQIARYAWGDDYHDVIGARLDALARVDARRASASRSRRARTSTPARCRSASTRSTPASAGSARTPASSIPQLGSWIFLAEIICSLPLEADAPALDQCGTCTLCLEACPTRALVGARRARRDAVHLVPDDRAARAHSRRVRAAVGIARLRLRRLPGVCPWNQAAPSSSDPAWQPRPAWDERERVDACAS